MSAPALRCHPSKEDFARLKEKFTILPVWAEAVADTLTPVAAFASLVGNGRGFLLESVEGGERWGRYSFVGRRPLATMKAWRRHVEGSGSLPFAFDMETGILSALEALLDTHSSPTLDGLPPLHGGLVGYLGYDVVREVERLENVPADDLGFPDAIMDVIGELVAFDHWRQRVILIENVVVSPDWTSSACDAAYESACARVQSLAQDCFAKGPGDGPLPPPSDASIVAETKRTLSSDLYEKAVQVAKEYIVEGDIFQVVLSQRFDLTLDVPAFEVYRALRLLNPSPYLYFLSLDEVTVVGSSPEPMVRLRDGKVISRPIAGSRPRGANEEQDRVLAGEMSEDPKEIAEHVMLVDLARNDVGRVVQYGSEKVDEMMTVERYSHIMHMTSQVSGTLRSDRGPIDVLRATIPAGTLSGAPKVRAMEIIDELEPTKRGIYGGVIGYLDFSGNLDTAIAIRTLVVRKDGKASVQAGAGIVADSDPKKEDEECCHKAAAILAAIQAARVMQTR